MPFLNMLQLVLTWMTGTTAFIAVAIAVAYQGYQLLFSGQHDHGGIPKKLIGAVLVLSAQTIAALFQSF